MIGMAEKDKVANRRIDVQETAFNVPYVKTRYPWLLPKNLHHPVHLPLLVLISSFAMYVDGTLKKST